MSRQGALEDERGFTLIEVMLTIVIMGIVFAIASSTWFGVDREPPGRFGDQSARRGPAAGAFQGDQQAWPQPVRSCHPRTVRNTPGTDLLRILRRGLSWRRSRKT